jgi:hypothetical protein
MKNYGERLKHLIESLGLTENGFASEIGLDRADVVYFVVKQKTKDPRTSFGVKIKERYPQINLNWLDAGVGSPLMDESKHKKLEQRIKELEEEIESNKMRSENKILRLVLTDEQKKIVGSFNPRVLPVQCKIIPFHPVYDKNKKTA